jgi:hypothetical protein
MSLNVIVLLLLVDDTDDDILCVSIAVLLHSNECIFLGCGNKHIFIGLTHQTTMQAVGKICHNTHQLPSPQKKCQQKMLQECEKERTEGL